jgi:hypothetical protein
VKLSPILLLAATITTAVTLTSVVPANAATTEGSKPITVTPETFGNQDDGNTGNTGETYSTGRVWAAWCTVQPELTTTNTEMVNNVKPAFDANLRTTRLNVTLGHPPVWVYNNTKAAANQKGIFLWYCQFASANLTTPTVTMLKTTPTGALYKQYVRNVITAAGGYLAADPANKLVFEGWNEPNLRSGSIITSKIAGGVNTWPAAANSMQQQERYIREVGNEMIPGRFEVSSPAVYGKRTPFTDAYWAAQSNHRTIDSVSVNFYTHNSTPNLSLQEWRRKAAKANLSVREHRKLRNVPIWVTETNHNLVNFNGNKSNLRAPITSPATQTRLTEVTLLEGLRAGYKGIEWYQGALPQTAVNTRPGTPGYAAVNRVRNVLVGRKLVKCRDVTAMSTVCVFTKKTATLGSEPVTATWSLVGTNGVTFK